ncbi:MAG: hypothetical protein LBR88_04955, partial [Zoogloeaceae bacterium]|nr:hypothetical protein [Zoogloeaceae bacterium]
GEGLDADGKFLAGHGEVADGVGTPALYREASRPVFLASPGICASTPGALNNFHRVAFRSIHTALNASVLYKIHAIALETCPENSLRLSPDVTIARFDWLDARNDLLLVSRCGFTGCAGGHSGHCTARTGI